ncbi:MAG: hypothetical protein ABSF63_01965 [Candidatus Bathyarchaeia archaeon]|jgi:uncharacterized membrane protein YesL
MRKRLSDWNDRFNKLLDLYRERLTKDPIWSIAFSAIAGVIAANLYGTFTPSCPVRFFSFGCLFGLVLYVAVVFVVVLLAITFLATIWIIADRIDLPQRKKVEPERTV